MMIKMDNMEGDMKEMESAKDENMQMLQGENAEVKGNDICHIREHTSCMDENFDSFNADTKSRIIDHMKGHLDKLKGKDKLNEDDEEGEEDVEEKDEKKGTAREAIQEAQKELKGKKEEDEDIKDTE